MGCITDAKCLKCGEIFWVGYGGGFFSHRLRCDKCGKSKSMKFDTLGELHERYLKGLQTPYCMASREHDQYIQSHSPLEPITKEEYHLGVEAKAGQCDCGGDYRFNAPPRCPKCFSTEFEKGNETILFD